MGVPETLKSGKEIIRRDAYVRMQSAVDENSMYVDDHFNPDRIYSLRSEAYRKAASASRKKRWAMARAARQRA